MMIFTGDIADLNKIDGYEKKGNRIEVVTDGAGIKYVPPEVIELPEFQELKPIFDLLIPIEYTPINT